MGQLYNASHARPMTMVVLDDDPGDLALFERLSHSALEDCIVHKAGSVGELKERLNSHHPRVALVDHFLGETNGTELIQSLQAEFPDTAFVLWTGRSDEQLAIEAMRAGAKDYLRKDELSEESLLDLLQRLELGKDTPAVWY